MQLSTCCLAFSNDIIRVVERLVRKYYGKITSNQTGGKRWMDLLTELEGTRKVKPALIGYLHYIRDRRNEAEHPDRRLVKKRPKEYPTH